jgi:leucyl-tRNA synthetase
MVGDYDFTAIEDRYQRAWIEADLWAAPEMPDPDRKRYLVTMFPYPSSRSSRFRTR